MAAVDAKHAAFVESRRMYLGGTDIAAITGLSPWASPLSVYLDKVAPEQAEQKESLPMRRGLALERFIADEFCRAKPGTVTYHPTPPVRTDWGFPAGASIDRFIASVEHPRTPTAILECKTAFSFQSSRQWNEAAEDLPDHYYVQCQWYLAVTELPWCYSAADVGAEALKIVPIRADEAVQAKLIDAGREFWASHVEADLPPEPNGSKNDGEALSRMYPETIPEPAVTIEDELAEVILSDYLAHSFKVKQHGDQADLAKQRLQALMGEHEQAVIGAHRLVWKPVTQNRIDSKALRAKRPEIALEFTKPTTSRRFEVKEIA